MVLKCCCLVENTSPKGGNHVILSYVGPRNELNCKCGESEALDWHWSSLIESAMHPQIRRPNTLVDISTDKRTVRFHRGYSIGTAAVKGDRPLVFGQEYFWQIKVLTKPYGTDVMFGIGTENFDIYKNQTRYTSLLGSDKDSWGISYRGKVQHDGEFREYCESFSQGSIIGVHLNLFTGKLQFYIDGIARGQAFEGLQNRGPLYPIVCSTAAYSSIRLITARSCPASLQSACFKILSPALFGILDSIPGLRNHAARDIAILCQQKKRKETPKNENSKPSSTKIKTSKKIRRGFFGSRT